MGQTYVWRAAGWNARITVLRSRLCTSPVTAEMELAPSSFVTDVGKLTWNERYSLPRINLLVAGLALTTHSPSRNILTLNKPPNFPTFQRIQSLRGSLESLYASREKRFPTIGYLRSPGGRLLHREEYRFARMAPERMAAAVATLAVIQCHDSIDVVALPSRSLCVCDAVIFKCLKGVNSSTQLATAHLGVVSKFEKNKKVRNTS
mmetsp:Transcript_37969/g.63845  ORF Transcript_37969/g.63845 Transcript_37969/m.63845 type:complete len:205 (-) Transcript_37969:254-868(-)